MARTNVEEELARAAREDYVGRYLRARRGEVRPEAPLYAGKVAGLDAPQTEHLADVSGYETPAEMPETPASVPVQDIPSMVAPPSTEVPVEDPGAAADREIVEDARRRADLGTMLANIGGGYQRFLQNAFNVSPDPAQSAAFRRQALAPLEQAREDIADRRVAQQQAEQDAQQKALRAYFAGKGLDIGEGVSATTLMDLGQRMDLDARARQQRELQRTLATNAAQSRVDAATTEFERNKELIRLKEEERRKRKGAGPGGGGGGGSAADHRAALVQHLVDRGVDPGTAEVLVPNDPKKIEQLRSQQAGTALAGQTREEEKARQMFIPGLHHSGQTSLPADQVAGFRKANDTMQNMGSLLDEMVRYSEQATAKQLAMGKLNNDDPLMANARQAQVRLMNMLREMDATGVPSEAEMRLMEYQVPKIDSASGLMSGANRYRALKRLVNKTIRQKLKSAGYAYPVRTYRLDGKLYRQYSDGTQEPIG